MSTFPISRLLATALTTIFVTSSTTAFADKLILRNGGKIGGTILPAKEDGIVVIRTDDQAILRIPKTQVLKEVVTPPKTIDYAALVSSSKETAASQWELAQTCRSNAMSELSRAHVERVVELDPENKSAWALLGYIPDEKGGWIRRDELHHQRGMELVDGKLLSLHAKALAQKQSNDQAKKAELIKRLKNEIVRFRKNDKNSIAAAGYLQNFADPIAIDFIEEQMLEELGKGGNGEIYMKLLLQMPGLSAVPTFTRLAMNLDLPEGDGTIVDRCLQALNQNEYARDIAVATFVGNLSSQSKKVPYKNAKEFQKTVKRIDRAGLNLQVVGTEVAIFSLINALITEGNVVVNKQQSQSFGQNGGSALSSGGATYITEKAKQETVLVALTILTNQNFGYDIARWRQWYALQYAKSNMDLRRIE